MKATRLLQAAVLVAVAFGCARPAKPTDKLDAAGYARLIKRLVLEFVQEAKKNPEAAGQKASDLLETLKSHPKQPVGEHKEIYAELTTKCGALLEAAKRSPGSAATHKHLDEMAALANKLPG